MTVLKWVLVIAGVVFLIIVAAIVGGYYWAQTVESVKITEADLLPGGLYPPEERQALLAACQSQPKAAADPAACPCLADKAATDFSRFERLAVIAAFEASPRKFVALIKGANDSGVAKTHDIDAIETKAQDRIKAALAACHIAPKQ